MKNISWGRVSVVLLVIVAFFACNMQAEWGDRFLEAKVVYLADILKNPQSWLDIPVRIPVRFHRLANIHNLYFTQFDEQYINFAAWDALTPIWEREGFNNDYAHFYFEKDNPELQMLLKLRPLDTICLLAKVSGIFKQKPYIRVTWLCHLPGTLNVDNLRMIYKGSVAFRERKFDDAVTLFNKALLTGLPDDLNAMLHKTIAKIYMYEKKALPSAVEELQKALLVMPEDEEAHDLLARCNFYIQHGGTPVPPVYVEEETEKKPAKPETKPEAKPITPAPETPVIPTPIIPPKEE